MNNCILSFRQIDQSMTALTGGKATNLGELAKLDGIVVPRGFCITTEAYRKAVADSVELDQALKELEGVAAHERAIITSISEKIRTVIRSVIIPLETSTAITKVLAEFGEEENYAVRSSATAEDLPEASFAGQQDTYLNVVGLASVLEHISLCWASLFTERAIIYRIQQGIDHRKVWMAVVIQQMIFASASGILFTADPVSSNRKIVSIDAGFGLGEAMVSGLVNADNYKVREGKVIDQKIAVKKFALQVAAGGGTQKYSLENEMQGASTLTRQQVLQLEKIGRIIESHFGCPQDIEWCLMDDKFYILQSRPVTTLFPVPERNDEETHVYVSVGHQQMMTDAMKPLGISIRQLTTGKPTYHAGGRMFVDVARDLESPERRNTMVNVLGKSDPLIRDALIKILEREDLVRPLSADQQHGITPDQGRPSAGYLTLNDYGPSDVERLIELSRKDIRELKHAIEGKAGTEMINVILNDLKILRQRLSDPLNFGVIMTPMNAAIWLNEKMYEWLGEKNVADTISLSVSGNITSEMGLELIDIADMIRPYPGVIAYLQDTGNDRFMDNLAELEGGKKIAEAIGRFLDKHGMRCAGEIDITRTRWSEKPITLVPAILSNIKNLEAGASQRKFEKGLQEAISKKEELLRRLKELPKGDEKAVETERMIGLVRNLSGYREYPKYDIVSRYFIYKKALLLEAEKLVKEHVISCKEDIYYLDMEELAALVRDRKADHTLIQKRRTAFRVYEKLSPPRIISSDGEVFSGEYGHKDLPEGALMGLAVSAGVVEGRARVILNMEDADLEEEDILVTPFTDPSWTPLFVSIKGLVTEVGGLMTHGAVIAREYGLPAVVGVENATKLIRDGDWIRVNGREGYIIRIDRG